MKMLIHRRDFFRTSLILPSIAAASPATASPQGAPVIGIPPVASPLDRVAANELGQYLRKIFGITCAIKTVRGNSAGFVICSGPASRPFLDTKWRREFDDLPDDGYLLCSSGPCLVLAGKSPRAALYAVYDLLERYGMTFFLSGDTYPRERRPFSVPRIQEAVRPLFPLRGTLPWYNFPMGPTGWSLADYEAYIDQLAKLRYNYLTFHFYSHEPFLSFRYKGTVYPTAVQSQVMGHPAIWPSERIRVGRERISGDYVGMPGGPSPAIAVPRLQEALEYARMRGLKTSIGLELSVLPVFPNVIPDEDFVGKKPPPATPTGHPMIENLDPTSQSAQDITRARLEALVKTYPTADYYTIWYSEHFQYSKLQPEQLSPKLRAFYEEHLKDFNYSQWHFSPGSFVMFVCWIELAHRILKALKPEAKMAISGWSIDSMFPGAQSVLPKDIVFSSLSGYEPKWALAGNVIDRYWKAAQGRERHYISWWEFDGRCLGLPEPKVKSYDPLFAQTAAAGLDGMIFLHWRTRILDGNARYTALRCWKSGLTPELYYRDYARTKFGPEAAPASVDALLALEEYEQWQLAEKGTYLSSVAYDYGALPQPLYDFCLALGLDFLQDSFHTVDPVDKDPATVLKALESPNPALTLRSYDDAFRPKAGGHGLEEAIGRLTRVREMLRPAEDAVRGSENRENLSFLTGRVEYYILYLRYYGRALEAYHALTADPSQPVRPRVLKSLELLRTTDAKTLVSKYAEHVDNPGERGVLLSLNSKIVDITERLIGRLEELSRV